MLLMLLLLIIDSNFFFLAVVEIDAGVGLLGQFPT